MEFYRKMKITRQKYEKLHTIVNYNLQSFKIERKKVYYNTFQKIF